MRHLGQLDDGDVGGEARHLKVRAMDLEEYSGVGRQCSVVIVGVRAIGCPDLHNPRPRPSHDVGNPERAADLDQLAARHDRITAACERAKRQQDGARGVVHDERVGRTGQLDQQVAADRVTGPARAAAEVVLERGVALGDARDRGDRRGGERGAAEVGVQHDTRRVDHGCERRHGEPPHGGAHRLVPPLGRRRPAVHTRLVDRRARRFHDERARVGREQRGDARAREERVN